ncbi:MAG: family transposase [Frankiales bacterium]|nr:family transposase [Frankiales bacterium]
MPVIEVARPNRQVRRRYGKTDVIDAIAAARAVQSGEATGKPKSHDGPVEALRALKAVQRSANKARTQALNQIHQLLVTAPEELRARLNPLPRREQLATCAAFRVRADDDTLAAVMRLALRELAQRVLHLDEQLKDVTARLRRITKAVAPDLVAIKAVGPDVASTLLMTAGDNPDRLNTESAFAALCGSNPIPAQQREDQPPPAQPRRRSARQRRPLADRVRPPRLRPTHPRLRRQAHRRRQEQGRDHALPQAIRRPRGLRRPTPRSPHLTVGASLLHQEYAGDPRRWNGTYSRCGGLPAAGLRRVSALRDEAQFGGLESGDVAPTSDHDQGQ